jgi:hypothetical protein
MAIVTFTVRYLDYLKPQPKRYEVFDALVPGLAIRITPAGHKSFTLYYRHHGRMRRVGLGRYPDVLLADARTAATQQRGRIFNGADPAEEKKAERATHSDPVGALFLVVQDASGEGEELDGDATDRQSRHRVRWRRRTRVPVHLRCPRDALRRAAVTRCLPSDVTISDDISPCPSHWRNSVPLCASQTRSTVSS